VVRIRGKTADIGEVGQRQPPKTSPPYTDSDSCLVSRGCSYHETTLEAQGVHLGRTSTPIEVARRLLVGIPYNTHEEVENSVPMGADYVGVGPVYATPNERLTSPLLGPRNPRNIIGAPEDTDARSVVIGMSRQASPSL